MDGPRETGWYRDPRHPDRHRFWDGERWQTQAEHLDDAKPADEDARRRRDPAHEAH